MASEHSHPSLQSQQTNTALEPAQLEFFPQETIIIPVNTTGIVNSVNEICYKK